MSFNIFCDIFKIHEINDPIAERDIEKSIYENCRSRDCPLFCRSGPWSTDDSHLMNDSGIDLEDIIEKDLKKDILEGSNCTKF